MNIVSGFLKKSGLEKRQIDIYLDLNAFPESTVVEISKRLDFPRSSIYLELDRMEREGYITVQRIGKSKKYSAVKPENFKYKLKLEKKELDNMLDNVDHFIEQVNDLSNVRSTINTVLTYKGSAGIKQLLWNILSSKGKLVVGFSPGTLENSTDRKFAEKWREEFQQRGMFNKIILNKPKKLNWSDVPNFLSKNVEAKSLEATKIRFQHEVLMYDDTTVIISQKSDNDQYGIEITDKLLTNAYKQLFNFIWEYVAYWPEELE